MKNGYNKTFKGNKDKSGNGFRKSKEKFKPNKDRKSEGYQKNEAKKLSNHMYYVGSARQASDFVTATNFIINHIRQHYKKGDDIAKALEEQRDMDFDKIKPELKQSTKTGTDKDLQDKQFEKEFEVDYSQYSARKSQYEDNKAAAHALLWAQCTNTMRSRIQSRKDYESGKINTDPIALLKAIQQHALSYESTQYRMKTVCDAIKSLVNMRQREDESAIDYLKRFKAAKDVFYSHVGKDFQIPRIVQEDKNYATQKAILEDKNSSDDEKKQAKEDIRAIADKVNDEFLGYLYLENTDRIRYGSIMTNLDAQFSLGHNQYPKSITDSQHVIENHQYDAAYKKKQSQMKRDRQNHSQSREEGEDKKEEVQNLSFAQMANQCYCCGKNHKLPDCPTKDSTPKEKWHINKAKEAKLYQAIAADINKVMSESSNTGSTAASTSSEGSFVAWQFLNADLTKSDINLKDAMVLDTASTHPLVCNKAWAKNAHPLATSLVVNNTTGVHEIVQEATLPGYGTVPFDPQAPTNILALGPAADKYRITYDSSIADTFYVHTPIKVVEFKRDPKTNLYLHVPQAGRKSKDPVLSSKENEVSSPPTQVYVPANTSPDTSSVTADSTSNPPFPANFCPNLDHLSEPDSYRLLTPSWFQHDHLQGMPPAYSYHVKNTISPPIAACTAGVDRTTNTNTSTTTIDQGKTPAESTSCGSVKTKADVTTKTQANQSQQEKRATPMEDETFHQWNPMFCEGSAIECDVLPPELKPTESVFLLDTGCSELVMNRDGRYISEISTNPYNKDGNRATHSERTPSDIGDQEVLQGQQARESSLAGVGRNSPVQDATGENPQATYKQRRSVFDTESPANQQDTSVHKDEDEIREIRLYLDDIAAKYKKKSCPFDERQVQDYLMFLQQGNKESK